MKVRRNADENILIIVNDLIKFVFVIDRLLKQEF